MLTIRIPGPVMTAWQSAVKEKAEQRRPHMTVPGECPPPLPGHVVGHGFFACSETRVPSRVVLLKATVRRSRSEGREGGGTGLEGSTVHTWTLAIISHTTTKRLQGARAMMK